MTAAPAPTASAPAAVRAPLLVVLGSPSRLFASLDRDGAARPVVLLLLAVLPLAPLLTGVVASDALAREFAGNPETVELVPNAPFIAVALGVAALVLQLVLLLMHLLVFSLSVRVAGTDATVRRITTAWLFAILPLVLRQVVISGVTLVAGAEWYAERSWLVQMADPFLVWTAVLLFLACRRALGLGRTASVVVTFLSSFVGLLSPLAEAVLG
ncbi:YIP1 family protein [Georgenia sp. Marseille-Q6866]